MFKTSIAPGDLENLFPDIQMCSDGVNGALCDAVPKHIACLLLGRRMERPYFRIRIMKACDFSVPQEDTVCFAYASGDDDFSGCASKIPEEFRQKDLEAFFAPRVKTLIAVWSRSAYVLIGKPHLSYLHLVCSAFPRYIPWIMRAEGAQPLTDGELEMLMACTKTSPEDWFAAMGKLEQEQVFQNRRLGVFFDRLNAASTIKSRANLENRIRRFETDIGNYEAQIERTYRLKAEAERELFGLLNMPRQDTSQAIRRAFAKMSNVSMEPRGAGSIILNFDTLLTNFPDACEAMIRNPGSVLYETSFRKLSRDQIRLIAKALFIDELLRIALRGCFQISARSEDGAIVVLASVCGMDPEDRLPNPHIHYFRCLGSWRPAIEQAVRNLDWDEVFSLCACSAGSVNLHELPSATHLFNDLFVTYVDKPVLRDTQGRKLTPRQAAERLREEDGVLKLMPENDGTEG